MKLLARCAQVRARLRGVTCLSKISPSDAGVTPHARPSESERANSRRRLVDFGIVPCVALTFVPLVIVTVWMAWSASTDARQTAFSRFDFKVREAEFAIKQRLITYEQVLRGGLALFAVRNDVVSRSDWRTYVHSLEIGRNYPGIQGIGFSQRISLSERESHEQRVRAEGFPDYRIRPDPDSARTELTSIIYLEPFDWRNQRAFGYDMFSEPVRRRAMERARDAGAPAVSGKVTLVQETKERVQSGFLMYLPVFRTGRVPQTVEERRSALIGYVYAPFRMHDLMDGTLRPEQFSNIRLEIFDGERLVPDSKLYDSLAERFDQAFMPTFETITTLEVGGQTWTIRFQSRPEFDATIDALTPRLILFGGLIVSALFSAVIWSLSLVRRRARDLVSANRKLANEVIESGRLAAQLEHAKEVAEGANRAKSRFLAAMSHELRTPLNAVLGYAQLLKRNAALSEWQSGAIDTIQRSGEHLLTLISDILDLAKIEAGKLELSPCVVDLPALISEVESLVQPRIDAKGLSFVRATLADLPRVVLADGRRLRQVLINLLGNAVKFTDRGRIDLQVFILSENGERVDLRVEVRDTGIGIAADRQAAIFRPFEQVCDPQRRTGGTGLGLSISQELLRLMGSNINVESKPGEGSRFWFDVSLPRAASQPVELPAPGINGYLGPHRRVLIVDDTPENRAVLAELLRSVGFEVHEAADGVDAVARAQVLRPDIVLMDVMMPVMDGRDATRRIRDLAELRSLPIIAISASVAADDRDRSLAAGADAFIGKPVDHRQLFHELGRLLNLEWIENPLQPVILPSTDLVVPPPAEMQSLHALACAGNMRRIRQRADHLTTLDPRYQAFADRLREFAKSYDSKGVLAFIEASLDRQQATAS